MESVRNFLKTVNDRSHVLQLIENVDSLVISFVSTELNIFFVFSRGKVLMTNNLDEHPIGCVIYGETKSIKNLLEGKEQLCFLIKNEELKVSAPFRTILLLESIFFLTKAEKRPIKTN